MIRWRSLAIDLQLPALGMIGPAPVRSPRFYSPRATAAHCTRWNTQRLRPVLVHRARPVPVLDRVDRLDCLRRAIGHARNLLADPTS